MKVEQRTNAQLQAELTNLRTYLSSHPGATPTRVTKKVLREIEPAFGDSPPRQLAWGEQTPEGVS